MSKNINLLLEKLDENSLAHSLVMMLKETLQETWPQVLEQKLTEMLDNKEQEVAHAQNPEANN
jgi:hypothetical protein